MMTRNTQRRSKKDAPLPTSLPTIRPKVAGLDVGSAQHWVCGPAKPDGAPNVRVFGTTTAQLGELAAWLAEQHVESVAMESTYVYWIPIYELLESRGIEVCSSTRANCTMYRDARPISATASGSSCSTAAGCCVAPSARGRPSPG